MLYGAISQTHSMFHERQTKRDINYLVPLGIYMLQMSWTDLRDERSENRPFYLVIVIWPQKSGKLGQM